MEGCLNFQGNIQVELSHIPEDASTIELMEYYPCSEVEVNKVEVEIPQDPFECPKEVDHEVQQTETKYSILFNGKEVECESDEDSTFNENSGGEKQ